MQPDGNFYFSTKRAWEEGSVFPVFFIVYIIAAAFLVPLNSKAEPHLFVNRYHSPFFDLPYSYINRLGYGLFAVGVDQTLVHYRVTYATLFAAGYLLGRIVLQLAKRLLFSVDYRPARYFEEISGLQLVEVVSIRYTNSFPPDLFLEMLKRKEQ
jgi:hypothetical protein